MDSTPWIAGSSIIYENRIRRKSFVYVGNTALSWLEKRNKLVIKNEYQESNKRERERESLFVAGPRPDFLRFWSAASQVYKREERSGSS